MTVLPRKAHSTAENERARWPHILERLGRETPLCAVTRAVMERYQVDRLREVSERTVNLEIQLVRGMLQRAVERGYIAKAPEARKLREHKQQRHPLTVREVQRLIEACRQQNEVLADAVEFAALTGCRRGEVLGLKWSAVDLANRTVTIRRPKNKRDRALRMSARVHELLEKRHRDSGGLPLVFPGPFSGKQSWGWRKGLIGAGTRIGLREPVGWHDLRRFFATQLDRSGTSMQTIRHLLGHAEIATTQRYVMSGEDQQQVAMESIGKTLGAANVLWIWDAREKSA